jgi:hypothetical protein
MTNEQLYAVTVSLTSRNPLSPNSLTLASVDGRIKITNRPLAPEGLSRAEFLTWYAGLNYDARNSVLSEASDWLNSLSEVRVTDNFPDNSEGDIEVVGGDKVYVNVAQDEEFEDAADALESTGIWKANPDGTLIDDGGNIVSLDDALDSATTDDLIEERFSDEEQWPPMWSTVWRLDYLLSWLTPQDVADFSGVTVYSDANEVRGYFIGVNGAGYDFYEAHWLPLAYLLGRLS